MDHTLMKINVDAEALCLIRANPAVRLTCDVVAIDEALRPSPKKNFLLIIYNLLVYAGRTTATRAG